jgi:hypothetical protein
MSILRTAEIPCQDLVELVTDYLEGALSPGDRRRFEDHLARCAGCTACLAQMHETLRLVGLLVPQDPSPDMQREFAEIYRRWQSGSPVRKRTTRLTVPETCQSSRVTDLTPQELRSIERYRRHLIDGKPFNSRWLLLSP